MSEAPFISVQHLPRLSKALRDSRAEEPASTGLAPALQALGDVFGNPQFLARTFIQAHCQSVDPEAPPDPGRNDSASFDRRPVFEVVDDFLSGNRESADRASRHQMFVLGDTGMGKTSLLVMLKLMQLAALWPKHHRCELLKIGDKTLELIEKIKTPRKTVLLLDALNEDPLAIKDVATRVAELLRATVGFRRVIITCRAQYQPDGTHDPSCAVGRLASAGHGCPTIYLSPFNDSQVDKYLKRRFRRMEEPNRKRAKIVLNGMGSLKFRPLVLSVADDFAHSRSKEWNALSIYETMFNAWLDREQRNSTQAKDAADDGGEKFNPDVLREACIKVARLIALGRPGVGLSAADLAAASLPAPESIHLAKLDCRGGSFLLRDSTGAYRYSHPSIQEYLIAVGLQAGVLHSGKKRIRATGLMITFLLQGRGSAIEWKALDLTSASLGGVQLQDAEFSGSLLASADLADAVFAKATFDNADLKFCEARGARFVECSFKATNAAHARAASIAIDRCRLTQASFADTALPGATFESCTIENTSFADADLRGAAFNKCTLAHCNFTAANLSLAQFSDCTLDGIKFDRCSLAGANFSKTTPTDVSLTATDVRGANLDESFISAAKSGILKNCQDAAWDPEISKRLRFPSNRNTETAVAIDRDPTR